MLTRILVLFAWASVLQADVAPSVITFQGAVSQGGTPFDGSGFFKFAIMDAGTGDGTTNYWSNDSTASGEPATQVPLAVTSGVFSVLLGDTSRTGITAPVGPGVFTSDSTFIRVWFSAVDGGPFQALEPNQRLTTVPYAMNALNIPVPPAAPLLNICDQVDGGIVIWVGGGGRRALIAATSDQSSGSNWSTVAGSTRSTGATRDGVNAGNVNSILAVAAEAALLPPLSALPSIAAASCQGYSVQADGVTACTNPGNSNEPCFGDWYLPSKFELNQLYLQGPGGGCMNLLGFSNANYWSSTESPSVVLGMLSAWSQDFGSGVQQSEAKVPILVNNRVRCVRSY